MDDHLLLDHDLTAQNFTPELATTGQRFANFLIDFVIFLLLVMLLGVVLALSTDIESIDGTEQETSFNLMSYAVLFAYYWLSEGFLGGKTIGKFITRTRAVTEDGDRLTMGKAALRSLCRFIPFDAFSAFGGQMWHDSIAKTIVIKDRR